ADTAELVALFRGLPLYPDPERLEDEAGEGLRSNMRPVFEAVAHHSPYPREVFGEHRWNHMVLKALFVDSPLAPIQGLDERANPELAMMLRDYARERRAAGRPISPELWRCLIPFAQAVGAEADVALADLERIP
ncbi:MAG: EboA domain-containing protein, partial [Ferrovibrionaceae bacterium]